MACLDLAKPVAQPVRHHQALADRFAVAPGLLVAAAAQPEALDRLAAYQALDCLYLDLVDLEEA